MHSGSSRRCGQHGYTYLLILFAIAALGVGAAQIGVVWQQAVKREREGELIYRATDIARAIGRYHAATPVGAPAWPQRLEDLIEDKRFPFMLRHLRRIWRDPFTGTSNWDLVTAGGGIIGVRSRSEGTPVRSHGLPPEIDPVTANAARHADWLFRPVIAPVSSNARAAAAAAAAATAVALDGAE